MSLVSCPECNKEVSDKVKSCIHCGYPISSQVDISADSPSSKNEKEAKNSVEHGINTAVDVIFSLLYLFLLYTIFFTDELGEMDSGAAYFGIFLAFVLIYFAQKIIKGVLGTIGRFFDSL